MSIVGLLLLSKKIHGKLKPGKAIVERSRIPFSQGVTLILNWVKMYLCLHGAGFAADVDVEETSVITAVIPETVTVVVRLDSAAEIVAVVVGIVTVMQVTGGFKLGSGSIGSMELTPTTRRKTISMFITETEKQ